MSARDPVQTALELRDVEILTIFFGLAYGEVSSIAGLKRAESAQVQETIKVADCTEERLNEAVNRATEDKNHQFWRAL